MLALSCAHVYSLDHVSLFTAYRRALPHCTSRDRKILRDFKPSDALLFRDTCSNNIEYDHAVLFCNRPSWDEDGLYILKVVTTTRRADFWNECRALFFEDITHYVSLVDSNDMAFFYALLRE